MADGTVRGGFELDAAQPISSLGQIRDRGREADTSLRALGTSMDALGGATSDARLNSFSSRLSNIGTTAESVAGRVDVSWRGIESSIDTHATAIEGRLDRLEVKFRDLGQVTATPSVELGGFDRVNAQIEELELRLDRLSHQRASPSVSLGGGFSGGGGGGGFAAAAAGGGGRSPTLFSALGGAPGLALLAGALSPAITGLIGGATSLIGSAGSATLGLGTVGIGGLGPLAVGGGLSALAIKPAITGLENITKAQTAYNTAIQEYGRRSTQAATARRTLNAAEVASPGAVGASRQLSQLRSRASSAFAPARAQAYRGMRGVFYNATRALPAIGADATLATSATSNAAIDYSSYLTQPAQLSTVRQLTQAFAADLPPAERSLENITTTLGHLAVAATPFFHEADLWVEHWTSGLAKSSSNTERVQARMQSYVNSAKEWGSLTGAAYRTIRDILSAGTGQGNSMVEDLTGQLNSWDQWITQNPTKVQNFFNQAETTTENIARAVKSLVGDIASLANYLTPIFNRAMQFISFVSGAGAGGIGVGGSLIYGAYEGVRGATGSRLPSAGSLGGAFITGGAGPSLMRGRGGTSAGVVGGRAYSTTLTRGSAGTYMMAPAGFQTAGPAGAIGDQLPLFAAGASGFAMRGSATATAARGEQAFNEAYGGIKGARFAPLEVGESRAYGLSRLAPVGGAALESAARFALPVLAITSLLQGAQTKGGVGAKVMGGLNSLGNLASFGLMPHQGAATGASILGLLGARAGGLGLLGTLGAGIASAGLGVGVQALVGAAPTGGSLSNSATQRSLNAIARQAGNVRTPQQLGALQTAVQNVRIQYELPPDQAAKLAAYLHQASITAADNAGDAASNTWQSAFEAALNRGVKPAKAVKTMTSTMDAQILELGPQGAKAFASSTAAWVGQLEQDDPKLRRPLARLTSQITDDVNNMNKSTNASFKAIRDQVFYFNGQILTGTQTTWGQISDALVKGPQRSQEQLLGIFGQIQTEALNALTQMGFTRSQAKAIVTASGRGGQSAANASFAVGATGAGIHAAPLSPTAPGGLKKNATGGMIPGSGLLDTVPVPGGMAAPGEAWIANRHTLNRLSSSTLATEGKTAWQIIRDETRQHSAPVQARQPREGIMAGYATGGLLSGILGGIENTAALGSLPGMIGTANAIASHRFPYLWGGGHNPAFSGPYDCSGAVSAVLHGGGALSSPEVAQWFMSYGLPGPGEVTIFASPAHTYMRMGDRYFGTSTSNPGGGAGWFNGSPRPGFVQRHIRVTGSSAGMGIGASSGALGGQSLSLNAPRSGLLGVPGALADQGSRIYASALQGKINARLGSGAGSSFSGAGFSGGGSASANQALGRRMMLAFGYGPDQWPSLDALWNQESGWNANALNSSSGAAGIPQALGHGSVFPLGQAAPQIAWGLNYIAGRYGSPAAAEAHERQFNWYGRGGRSSWAGWHSKGTSFLTNGPTLFGAGEGARRERVTVMPTSSPAHSMTGAGAGGARIQVIMQNVHLSAQPDQIAVVAEQVAGKILAALEGSSVGGSDADLIGAGS